MGKLSDLKPSPTSFLRISVVEKSYVFRTGIVALLKTHLHSPNVDSIENDAEILKNLTNFQPQLVIITVGFIDAESGLSTLMKVRAALPDATIIAYDTYPSFAKAIEYIGGPASGYLSRDDTDNELITCIDIVSKGKLYICKSVHHRIIDHLIQNRGFIKYKNLTPTEMEIAKQFARGLGPQDITKITRLKLSTIRAMRSRIYGKLHVRNDEELRDRLLVMKAL